MRDNSQIYCDNIIYLELVPVYGQFGTLYPNWNPMITMSREFVYIFEVTGTTIKSYANLFDAWIM